MIRFLRSVGASLWAEGELVRYRRFTAHYDRKPNEESWAGWPIGPSRPVPSSARDVAIARSPRCEDRGDGHRLSVRERERTDLPHGLAGGEPIRLGTTFGGGDHLRGVGRASVPVGVQFGVAAILPRGGDLRHGVIITIRERTFDDGLHGGLLTMRRSPRGYLARPTRRGRSGHPAHERAPAVQGIARGATVAEDTPPALRGESAPSMIGSELYVNTSTRFLNFQID